MKNKSDGKIIGFFTRLSSSFFDAVRESRISYVLSRGFGGSAFSSTPLFKKIKYKAVIPVKRKISASSDKSVILRAFRNLISSAGRIPLRTLGIGYFTLGITSAAILVLSDFLYKTGVDSLSVALRLAVSAIAVTALISSKTVGSTIFDSRILSFIFGRFLGREQSPDDEKQLSVPNAVPVVIGLLLGALTFFVPLYVSLAVPVLFYAVGLILKNPYTGVLFATLCIPFVDGKMLCFISLFVLFSMLLKLLSGKRNVKLSLVGVLMFGLGAIAFICGIVGKNGLLTVCPMLLFFITVTTLFKTDGTLEKLEKALAFPGAFAALSVLLSFAVSYFGRLFGTDVSLTVCALPHGALMLSMICALPFIVTLCSREKDTDTCIVRAVEIALICLAVYIEGGTLAFIIALCSLSLMLVISFRRSLGIIIPLVFPIVLGFSLVWSKLKATERAAFVFERLINDLPRNVLLFGGSDAEEGKLALGVLFNTDTLSHVDTFSLITVCAGIIALVLFVLAVLFTMANSWRTGVLSSNDDKKRLSVCAGSVSLIALFALCFIYELSSPCEIMIFALLMGFTAASQRLTEKHNENDTIDVFDIMYGYEGGLENGGKTGNNKA